MYLPRYACFYLPEIFKHAAQTIAGVVNQYVYAVAQNSLLCDVLCVCGGHVEREPDATEALDFWEEFLGFADLASCGYDAVAGFQGSESQLSPLSARRTCNEPGEGRHVEGVVTCDLTQGWQLHRIACEQMDPCP